MTIVHKIWKQRWFSQFEVTLSNSLGMNSSMFTNCSVFCDVQHVRSSVLGQNVMFGSVQSSVLLLCDPTRLRTYSLMFANCSVFCDVRHVWSSVLGQNVMFRTHMGVLISNIYSDAGRDKPLRQNLFWSALVRMAWALYAIVYGARALIEEI